MKRLFKELILPVLIAYMVMVFIAMDIDPDEWNIWLRVLFCIFFFSTLIKYQTNDLK